MRISNLFESILTEAFNQSYRLDTSLFESDNRVMFHGTDNSFDSFDVFATPRNRGTNVSGAYFTPRESEARTFGRIVIPAILNYSNPFYSGRKNRITPDMVRTAKRLLLNHTRYSDSWLDEAILPDFSDRGNFSGMDISGDLKREILLSGGYDAYIDGDHVAILNPNPSNITVVGE